MGKVKTAATVFELPQKLGILQYVEYEPCSGCIGLLTAEGCKKGICVRYRVWVSKDGKKWEAVERWRRRGDEEVGGCLRQQVADALWELAERSFNVEVDSECSIIVNGVIVPRPRCRAVDECAEQILEEYKRMLESPPPPRRSPEEEEYEALLLQYAWLGWWRRDLVLDMLRHSRQTLLDLLRHLSGIPYFVAAFIGRFELDFRCIVGVFRDADSSTYCVSFCVKDAGTTTYCYEPSRGWRHAQQPKFLRLKPLDDGRLAEVYAVDGKELIRIV